MITQPTFFIGHGSPMNLVYDNSYTQAIQSIKNSIQKPDGILIISAHWVTDELTITSSNNPPQVYDFYGFDKSLYNIKYNSKTNTEFVKRIKNCLNKFQVQIDEKAGYDHGTWAVLYHMFPENDIPVIQLSINVSDDFGYYFQIGQQLKELRDENILIIGSGNIVHNLRIIDFENIDSIPFKWAIDFDKYVMQSINSQSIDKLLDIYSMGDMAILSHPSPDHFIPLLYVLGAAFPFTSIETIHEGFQNKSISMRCLRFN